MESVTINIDRSLEYDVCVVGGGIAGACAAIASARSGAKTVLIESSGILGGQGTLGIVTPISATSTRDGKSFGGLVGEIKNKVEELTEKYCSFDVDKNDYWGIASPHILKYVLVDEADKAGVCIRFHTNLLSAECDGERIKSITVLDKSGVLKISSSVFIDASGDADLTFISGAEWVKGSESGVFDILEKTGFDKSHVEGNNEGQENVKYKSYEKSGLMQPVSIFFVLGGVDTAEAYKLNNKVLKFGDLGITREKFLAWKFAGSCGFEIGDDDRIPMPQGRILVTKTTRKNTVAVNMSRVIGIDGSDADSLSDGEIKAQKQIIAIIDFLKTFIPAFKDAYYIQSGSTLGIRETRRMIGKYVLSGFDVINCRNFDDCIARGSYMIDIHDPNGKSKAVGDHLPGNYYDIPYRAIISKTYNNLLACGRCISSDHVAHASTRIMGTCIMTGQAAGVAAAMASNSKIPLEKVNITELRDHLIDNGLNI